MDYIPLVHTYIIGKTLIKINPYIIKVDLSSYQCLETFFIYFFTQLTLDVYLSGFGCFTESIQCSYFSASVFSVYILKTESPSNNFVLIQFVFISYFISHCQRIFAGMHVVVSYRFYFSSMASSFVSFQFLFLPRCILFLYLFIFHCLILMLFSFLFFIQTAKE